MLAIGLLTGIIAGATVAPTPEEGGFSYLHRGQPVLLVPSTRYAAAIARDELERSTQQHAPEGWVIDPRSAREELMRRGLTLFRLPFRSGIKGLEPQRPRAQWTDSLAAGLAGQPVFELGSVLRIPTDEIVVAFPAGTTTLRARRILRPLRRSAGLRRIVPLRPHAYVVTLERFEAGRALQISRAIAGLEGVRSAEPNFVTVFLEHPGPSPALPPAPAALEVFTPPRPLEAPPGWRQIPRWERVREIGTWQVLVDGHFEGDVTDWSVAHAASASRIEPAVTDFRSHDGTRSVYMSAVELAGKRAPGPYGENANAFLLSPSVGLAGYADVFVELWFWGRFEGRAGEPPQAADFGRVLLLDGTSGRFTLAHPIAPTEFTGDLADDPTTDRGWRRMLFRVPDAFRGPDVRVVVQFVSDARDGAEGLYVDDVRVLASSGVPWTNDLPTVRQWALSPLGQVATRPAPEDPVPHAARAWRYGDVSSDVPVALLDDGVERAHPDLVFWEPADAEPLEDRGEPLYPEDRHGTACAGLIGALSSNADGIAGLAPGARLLPLRRGVDDAAIARSVDEAVRRGARVLAIPWGWPGARSAVIADAITDATARGTVTVAAAGDRAVRDGSLADVDFPCELGAAAALVCVGAASPAGEPKTVASVDGLWWWSSAGDRGGPDLVAPGSWLPTTDRSGPAGYSDTSAWTEEFAGSGAAACFVSGAAALMLSRDPKLTADDVRRMLISSAHPVAAGQRGIVDVEAAVALAVESAARRSREVDN